MGLFLLFRALFETRALPLGTAKRQAAGFEPRSVLNGKCSRRRTSTLILQIISIDKYYPVHVPLAIEAGSPRVSAPSPGKSALGKEWGPGGKGDENAFSRSAAKRLGPPAPAATKWRPQAVPVGRRRSLTDIDSRARPNGGRRPCPLGDAGALRASTAERGVPPKQTANSVNSS